MNRAQLMTARAAASTIGVHLTTVRRWISTGHLPGVKVGARYYVHRDAVIALVAAARAAATDARK